MSEIKDILLNKKNCLVIYDAKKQGITKGEEISDLLAIKTFSKEDILNNIKTNEEYLYPNVIAINVLDNFDELRLDLNRILKNSDWANESCIIIEDVKKEDIELLERFSAHYNVSMVLNCENEIILVSQANLLEFNSDYVFKKIKNEDFAKMMMTLYESVNELNNSYKEISDRLDLISHN